MKQRSAKIFASISAIATFLVAVVPHPAFAGFLDFAADRVIFSTTAYLSQVEMGIAGALVGITGALLNATMTATLHMSEIVNNTPAVGLAWTTVRDFGSVFIIFMLLYASIKMILGVNSGIGTLIKNIVIAGLLINFSLFFTKLAVDASNIISLSFYSAIAPTGLGQNNSTSVNSSNTGAGVLTGIVSSALNDGGLANVFMQSLDLQSFANSASSTNNADLNNDNYYWNITFANSGAASMMFFAAISFLVAAMAFAVRIGVLILLMAFSPIYFIALIFPDLKEYSQKWTKMLYSMCVFMPVYLFLMYVAMSVINDPHFFDFARAAKSGQNITGGVVGSLISANTIGTVLQYIIAILLINAPLMAAISIAGDGAGFLQKMMKDVSKWGQGAITNAQKGTAGFIGRNTGGRLAQSIADSAAFKSFARNNTTLGLYANRGLKNIAGSYNEGAKKDAKSYEEHAKTLALTDKELENDEHFRRYDADIREKLDEARRRATEADAAAMAAPNASAEEQQRLLNEAMAAQNKVDTLTGELTKTRDEKKEAVRNMPIRDYVKALQEGSNPLTKEGRKQAAKNIIKGLDKKKADKILSDLRDELQTP